MSRSLGKDERPRYGDIISWTANGVLRMVVALIGEDLITVPLNRHVNLTISRKKMRRPESQFQTWYIHE